MGERQGHKMLAEQRVGLQEGGARGLGQAGLGRRTCRLQTDFSLHPRDVDTCLPTGRLVTNHILTTLCDLAKV